MDIKTFKAKTMRDALELVRRELGPSAAVLHTREVNSGPISRLVFGRRYGVAVSAAMNVPSRLAPEVSGVEFQMSENAYYPTPDSRHSTPSFEVDYRARYRDDFRRQVVGQIDELHAMVEKLCD